MRFGTSRESLGSWTANAAFWDGRQGDDGSLWQRTAVAPAVERLLALRLGEEVLELCCGNGGLARRLARGGARVVASDGVAAMLDLARARSQDLGDRIEWRRADVTQDDDFTSLGPGPYDAAVCSMAIMDLPDIEPLFRGVRRLVARHGRLVVATLHPCFMTPEPVLFEERETLPDGTFRTTSGVRLTRYRTPLETRGVAMEGQPALQPSYHRTLSDVLGTAFAAGWALDGIEEPAVEDDGVAKDRLRWTHLREIAPLLVLRFTPR